MVQMGKGKLAKGAQVEERHKLAAKIQRKEGNLWKGPFHLPRMQLVCWRLLEDGTP